MPYYIVNIALLIFTLEALLADDYLSGRSTTASFDDGHNAWPSVR